MKGHAEGGVTQELSVWPCSSQRWAVPSEEHPGVSPPPCVVLGGFGGKEPWGERAQEPPETGSLSQAPAVCQTAQAEGGPCCDASKCHGLSTGRAAGSSAGPEEQLIAQKNKLSSSQDYIQ